MKILPLLTMVPALSMAGQISGKVSDLDGRPLAGVEVQGRHESDISKPSGAWTVGAALGRSPVHRDLAPRNASLVHQQGRLSWATGGRAIDGRSFGSLGGISRPAPRITAARAFEPETLWVYWNGKRLAQIPLASSDTAGVSVRIDTGWSDDNGIPWNPRIEYGSVRDAREATTYRVVQIGGTKWMAENLRLTTFDWATTPWSQVQLPLEVAELQPMDSRALYRRDRWDSSSANALCPEGWRLPTREDLLMLAKAVGECQKDSLPACPEDSLAQTGTALRALSGWPSQLAGSDRFGLRLLPVRRSASTQEGVEAPAASGFWLADTWKYRLPLENGSQGGFLFVTGVDGPDSSNAGHIRVATFRSFDFAPIRCVQDAPSGISR